ncbi:MAG: hypothetical protein KAR05_03890 [Candidatus Omnitrophica bacterium]|nr:hypothetical protein [Candidatus Omnitrophota bacterium]
MTKTRDEQLGLIHTTIREELQFRRSREQQIFTWSSTILIAITGAMLLSKAQPIIPITTLFGKSIGILMVLLVSFGSASWQMKQRKLLAEAEVVICKTMIEMGLFDIASASGKENVLPEKWKRWGKHCKTWKEQLTQPSKILCTIFLGIVAALSVAVR